MRNKRLLLTSAALLAGLVGSASLHAQDQSQSGTGGSVADAARKAREQKKNAPKPKHVLTDDDVAPRAGVTPPPAAIAPTDATQAQDGASPQASGTSEPKEDPHSEAAWRKRFAAIRRKISEAQTELDVLTREAQKADVQYYSDPQKAMKEQYSRTEINEKNEKIAAKKKEIEALNQQLGSLEDELRRSGGDPGWAR